MENFRLTGKKQGCTSLKVQGLTFKGFSSGKNTFRIEER
jgi:hypothetical protein